MSPVVSVCIPVYRQAEFVEAAVASALAALPPDSEVVVADDASPDASWARLQAFAADPRVRLQRNAQNLGMSGNWNHVIALSRGRYVRLMGGDDLVDGDSLLRHARILEREPHVSFVASPLSIHVGDEGVFMWRASFGREGRYTHEELVSRCAAAGGNAIGEPVAVTMRRECFDRAGGFLPAYRYATDLDMWLRLARLGPMYFDPEPAGAFRVHQRQVSARSSRLNATELGLIFAEHGRPLRKRDRVKVHARTAARFAFMRTLASETGRRLVTGVARALRRGPAR